MFKKIMLLTLCSILFLLPNRIKLEADETDCNYYGYLAGLIKYEELHFSNYEETFIQINFYNMSDEIYFVVTNDYNDDVITVHNSDMQDGRYTINNYAVNFNVTYLVNVYSSDTSCGVEPIRSFGITTAKYNPYSISDLCKENMDIEECDPFYDSSEMSFDDFNDVVNKKIQGDNINFLYYLKKYFLYALVPIIIISLIYIVKIILYKRRNRYV